MNDVATKVEQTFLQQEYPVYIGIFMVIVIVIAVLSFMVINQSRKLNELKKPKYGFLGKPLAVLMVVGLLLGSYGVIFFANRNATGVDSVSADKEITLDMTYNYLGNDEYVFKLTPLINNELWGKDPENQFDVYWTFTSTRVITAAELELSMNKPGGVVVKLQKGTYKVRANVFHEDKSYTKEIDIELLN